MVRRGFQEWVRPPLEREFTHDFMFGHKVGLKGITYVPINECYVFPAEHESLHDLTDTISHESIHSCIKGEDAGMDEDREERLVVAMMMAAEGVLI